MDIYILSSGRAWRQTTWYSLPPLVRSRTKIVVPWDEQDNYAAYPILTDPDIVRDLARTRKWLCDRSPKICMLDDDLVFATRRLDDPTKFRTSTQGEVEGLFEEIADKLNDYHHVGVASREGGNYNTDRYMKNTRMMRVLAYNSVAMRENGVEIDRLKFMLDFDVTLQFLRKGFENIIINWIVQNQNGSNTEGGCSQYRTTESQSEDARKLRQFHPEFVALVIKETKNWGLLATRTDVRVQWKKAYEHGRAVSRAANAHLLDSGT